MNTWFEHPVVKAIFNSPLIRNFNLPHLGSKYNCEFHGNSFRLEPMLSDVVVLISVEPLTYGRVKPSFSAGNMSEPRALFDELPDFGKRSVWCHQNCWESNTLQAPACLRCLIAGVVSPVAVIAAWVPPSVRFIYIGAYLGDIPPARGLCWASGLLLYKEGLTALLSA